MNNIRYDQGTFSYVLMLSAISVQIANATPIIDTHHINTLVSRAYVSSNDESATFIDNVNYVGDPYVRFLTMRRNPLSLVSSNAMDNFPEPKTDLGRKLLEYRRAALAKGMRTLSVDEIDTMVKEGRGAFV